jgi:quercetin dioxygenase-like cupin family protein
LKIYRFDEEVGKPIQAFGSRFSMSRIGAVAGEVHIGCMHFDCSGLVGRHEATVNQLFLVIEGQGWVSGEGEEKIPIRAGEAAYWIKGESHESGTFNQTMKAIVLEGEQLNPDQFMIAK